MITLFHDYTSPASAVAVLRAQRLADEGLAVRFAGFDAIGVDVAVPVPPAVAAAVADLEPAATAEGLRLRRPAMLPPTARAHVIERLAERLGAGPSWRRVCYRAFWEEEAPLDEPAVLEDLAEVARVDRERAAAALRDPRGMIAVRRATAEHRRQGVGGVPAILAQRTLVPGLLGPDELRALARL